MAAAICRFAGARYIVVTDLNEYRLNIAGKMGATKVINPSKESIADVLKELGMVGFDLEGKIGLAPSEFPGLYFYRGGARCVWHFGH